MLKVVIDTNILIGASYDELSHSKQIIDEVIAGRIKVVASHQTLRENKLLLGQAVKDRDYKELLNDFFARVEQVRVTKKVSISDDPEDNKFIEVALEAKAEYIITNDSDLLFIREYQGVKMVKPKDFWHIYKGKDDDEWGSWMGGILGK